MKNFEFKAERKDIISQKVPENIKEIYPIFKDIDKMPKGCAVIGGAARNLAFYVANPSVEGVIPIRDVDIAFFSDEISKDEADIYAEKFSPEDYAHGHGAQEIFDTEEYMDGRDFTMNQVIYKDGELIMSRAAIRDIYKGVVNPCDGRGDYWGCDGDDISTRLAMKAVLQETVLNENIKINDKDIFFDNRGNVRELYDIMTDLNEDILRFPFDFRDSAFKYFMDETNDAVFEEGMREYGFFEDMVDKYGDYRYR